MDQVGFGLGNIVGLGNVRTHPSSRAASGICIRMEGPEINRKEKIRRLWAVQAERVRTVPADASALTPKSQRSTGNAGTVAEEAERIRRWNQVKSHWKLNSGDHQADEVSIDSKESEEEKRMRRRMEESIPSKIVELWESTDRERESLQACKLERERTTCRPCKGQGVLECPSCIGTFGVSSWRCPTCVGSSIVFCSECDGSGIARDALPPMGHVGLRT
mmetsp:Transcript_8649/g.17552  ORF Transcript_8649/g.17552 Transcript_8649/m.17552 type:complete len:219 (+) Transcript_8649:90-746(+)